jgi:hypothetical protein
MTVLGDRAQATGPHEYTTWERLGALLSDHGDWRVAELSTSYRVPAEIMEFVAPLARAVAPSLPYPAAVRLAGEEAVRLVPANPWELLDETASRTARLVGTDDGQSLRSIAVVVPDDSDWLEEVERRVDLVDGMTEEKRRTVSVLPAAQAKGMEFDHVLVLEPSTIADRGPAGLRQLYVALTRSTQTLTVLHTTPLPRELVGPATDDDTTRVPTPTATPVAASPAPSGAASPTAAAEAPGGTGSSADEELPVGTAIKVRVLARGTGAHWKAEALAPATGRTLLLVTRHGEPTPRTGARLDAWVTRNEGPVSLVTAGDFGRRPVTARMAPRYTAALGILQAIADGDGTVPPGAADRLSELKGMANRCLRRDRVDWLSVWRLLGSADRDRLSALADLAQRTRHAVTAKTPGLHTAVAADPVFDQWAGPLAQAQEELRSRFGTETAPPEPEGAPGAVAPLSDRPDTGPAEQNEPEQNEPEQNEPGQNEPGQNEPEQGGAAGPDLPLPPEPRQTHEQKDTHSMDAAALSETAPSRTAPRTAAGEAFARELALAAEADRECNTHEAVRFELMAALLRAGLRPSDSPEADVIADGPHGLFLYEVLGAGRFAHTDLRGGAARLMEIDHIASRSADRRFLVLSGPPTEDWAPDAVRGVFAVDTIWRTPDGWEGQDIRTALHLPD